MIELTRQDIELILTALQADTSDAVADLRGRLGTELHNNPKYAEPQEEGSISGISVPPRFDEHGKLPPGCL